MAANGVLFVHNNYPGQFGFLADALRERGVPCRAIGSASAKTTDIPIQKYSLTRGTTTDIFPAATRAEADLIRAHAAVARALAHKAEGFHPELIIGHPGWGETLLLEDVYPDAKQILHGEFYYHPEGADVGFDPQFPAPDLKERLRIRAKNATMALAYVQARAIVCPTRFQASLFPRSLAPLIRVIHEGIDTDAIRPDPEATFTLANGRVLDRSTPVITFINRNFEPLRGFQVFMRALPRVLAAAPDAQVVLIGSDKKGYGFELPEGATWKAKMLEEVGDRLDLSRVHFTGPVPHARMLAALSISAAHVYYTYPFVLSWSLLEAMASECLIIGSDTAPLRDAVEPGKNGLLFDFFDVDALSDALIQAVRRPGDFATLRRAARQTVIERYDRARLCLPAWLELIDEVRASD
ncbi:MAG: glycosyltransferase [Proteobacteria bacterium]|nr:glycosyltransferase [Pseudomonadota bacterium]